MGSLFSEGCDTIIITKLSFEGFHKTWRSKWYDRRVSYEIMFQSSLMVIIVKEHEGNHDHRQWSSMIWHTHNHWLNLAMVHEGWLGECWFIMIENGQWCSFQSLICYPIETNWHQPTAIIFIWSWPAHAEDYWIARFQSSWIILLCTYQVYGLPIPTSTTGKMNSWCLCIGCNSSPPKMWNTLAANQ